LILKPMGLFATPESTKALEEYIERLNGPEKAMAYVIMGMTWNLCAKLTNEEGVTNGETN
jgi:hypothetical protein